MENSIYTPPKKEGFRTKSKVALKKKGALFGHSSPRVDLRPSKVPFDPRAKRTEGKLKGPDGNIFRITKGAPHVVLEISLLWRVPSSCTFSSTSFAQTGRGQLARARHTRCALACTGAHGPRGWRMEDAGHSHLPRPPAPRHQGHNREVRLLRSPR